jgi:small nuclear ribonucleoprotein (snRNP)-like protein
MNNRDSVFNYLRSELMNKKIVVITPKKNYEGKLIHCDAQDNLTLLLNSSRVLIQRQYIISIETIPEEKK